MICMYVDMNKTTHFYSDISTTEFTSIYSCEVFGDLLQCLKYASRLLKSKLQKSK